MAGNSDMELTFVMSNRTGKKLPSGKVAQINVAHGKSSSDEGVYAPLWRQNVHGQSYTPVTRALLTDPGALFSSSPQISPHRFCANLTPSGESSHAA
jgi:hypothetical protein